MALQSRAPDTVVARPGLVGRLSEAIDSGGVLLTAAAGYGKTTVLRETLATRSGATVWISCAATGGDAGLLLLVLVNRLREVAPGSADVLAERLEATLQRVDAPSLARTLRTDLERLLVEPIVLVLDDAEELEGSTEAVELVDVLLHTDPRVLRLVVVSRRPLALRVGKLLATGRLTEVGADELAFTVAESTELLTRRDPRAPTDDEVAELMLATGGWPLGVALGVVAPGHPGASPQAEPQAVFAFLEEEVLGGLDAALRWGILEVALPLDFDARLLAALALPSDLPARAQRAGVVLRAIGDGDQWAFHPLVREFLRARLATECPPAELAALNLRVAEVLAAAGREREAVEHYLDAGEWRGALAVAGSLGQQLQRMSPDRVRAWLGRLPAEAWAEPHAQLVLGQLEWGAGRHERAIPALRRAVAGYDERGELLHAWLARWILCDALFSTGGLEEILRLTAGWDDPRLAPLGPLPVGVAWYGAFVLLSQGRFEEGEPLLERLHTDPILAPLMRHFDRMFTAYDEIWRGRVDAALALMADTVEELSEYDPGNRASYALATYALMQMDCGRRGEALETWGRLAVEAGTAGLAFAVTTAGWERAYLLAEAGELEPAELELGRTELPVGGGWHDRSYHKARAAIALLRGEPQEALDHAERALELVRSVALNFRVWTACEVAPIMVAAGAPRLARAAIEDTLDIIDGAFAGARGRYPRARMLAVRAWIASVEGDLAAAHDDLRRAWVSAEGCEHHLLRVEWARIEPLLDVALERGVLDADSVIAALQHAFPGGAELVRFVDHPVAELRRAALPAAIASGHPHTLARMDRLTRDRDPRTAALAAAAREALRRSPPPLSFRVLGGFEARRASWTVDGASWGRPLVARLVRFLLIHRDAPVPEDVLFEAFWPDKAPAAARRNLAVALSLARKALDVPGAPVSVVETDGRAVRLPLGPADHLDSHEFEVAAAAALAASGAQRRVALERAEALWGGPPLPEELYVEWTFAWRERLNDRYSHVLTALQQAYADAHQPDDALRLARKRVELDPLNESAQRELIASYARAGRRNHALRQFAACRRVLVDELGIEPAEATCSLQERVLAGLPV